jgi:hypothetical protein
MSRIQNQFGKLVEDDVAIEGRFIDIFKIVFTSLFGGIKIVFT